MQTVDPRLIWPHEALNLTPWLLSNVGVLSDLLGMDLVLEEAGHPVGQADDPALAMEGRKAARLYVASTFTDVGDRDRWPQMTAWLVDTRLRLRQAWAAVGEVEGVTALDL